MRVYQPPVSTRDSEPGQAAPSSATRVLGILAAIVVVLTLVFGISIVRQRRMYRAYVERTLEHRPPAGRSIERCVTDTVDWAMACPGVESWCANEAPRVARECFAPDELATYCRAQGEKVAQTAFGVGECATARETVEGKYAQRAHKKYCASIYRALAEACRELSAAAP